MLKEAIVKTTQSLQLTESRYEQLKQHASEKLHEANKRINQMKTESNTDLQTLSVKLAKSEEQVRALEQIFAAKIKEEQELHQIFEEGMKKLEWTLKANKSKLNSAFGSPSKDAMKSPS